MASIWRHPNSSYYSACFPVHSTIGPQRWKRSIKTKDAKLARRIADMLDDAGRGTLTEQDINSFGEKIYDVRTRGAVKEVSAEVFGAVNGREMGGGSLR